MKRLLKIRQHQRGFALLELLVAVSLLSTAGVAFLYGLNTGILATNRLSNERAAMDVARSQMEYIKTQSFNRTLIQDPDGDWRIHYGTLSSSELPKGITQSDISVSATGTDGTDLLGSESVQLITVTVKYERGRRSATLQGYKTDRNIV